MSPKQNQVLRFVTGFLQAKGYSPSYPEIAVGTGRSPKTKAAVGEDLNALEAAGYIRRLRNRARAIEVLRSVPIPRGLVGEPLYFLPAAHLQSVRD